MGDIFSEHGIVQPGRGKGTRLSRMGKKVSVSAHIHGRTHSPNEEALQQLNRLLEEHDNVPPEVRQQYLGLYSTSDSLRHMNRPVLAEVMALMYQYRIGSVGDTGEVTNLHVFSNPSIMQPYIDRVFTRTETSDQRGKISDLQKQVMSIKMTDTMFSYLRNILHLISTLQQRSQSADISTLEGPAIDQQLDIVPTILTTTTPDITTSNATSSSLFETGPPIPVYPTLSASELLPMGFSTAPTLVGTGPAPRQASLGTQQSSAPTLVGTLPSLPNLATAPQTPAFPFPSASLPQLPALSSPLPTMTNLTGYQPAMSSITPQLF